MMTCGGPSADLFWSYLPAASLGAWTLTATPKGTEVTADVLKVDASRIDHGDLTFRVARGSAAPWIWPVESLQIANGVLTARLTTE
jgi:hypothetical protein